MSDQQRTAWRSGRPEPTSTESDMTTGTDLIHDERVRQIEEEGWTPEHDAEHHVHGALLDAARCYITSAEATQYSANNVTFDGGWRPREGTPSDWPWEPSSWKPTGDPVRDLVKAGALIAAEIDRLTRASKQPEGDAS